MKPYNPQKIEAKWAKIWEKTKAWKVNLKTAKKPYYNLMMFPYPSAEGLHVGNVYAFTGSDIHGRFRRMQGFDVFEPMGFDSFGIHSENFAIKKGTHPKTQTAKNISNFTKQLKALGALFAWDHKVITSEPNYYKWTQWLFLRLYRMGLAYKAKAPVDWCPSCKTVLANEQVIDEKCERCSTQVIQKELEQWFFRITKYADRLLKNLETIDWSERTKIAQRNWIGKSEGLIFTAPVKGSKLKIQTFSAHFEAFRADTFVVIAPDHPLLETLVEDIPNKKEVLDFAKQIVQRREKQGQVEEKNPEGIFTGKYIVDPVGNGDLPIWVANYAIKEYGTGIVKCSVHDERDFAFAKKYDIRLKPVLFPKDEEQKKRVESLQECYVDMANGFLTEPDEFAGRRAGDTRQEIVKYVVKNRLAEPKTQYHLRDWLISRQRYWGPPIPVIYCEKCGTVPVPEKDLPVLLPNVKDFRPTGTDKSPLASVEKFVKTKCPNCKSPARRETDVSDNFFDSAWYFFRYPCAELKSKPFDKLTVKKWLPVDMYIGGQEHAVLHLLYTRFITMAFKDIGFIGFEEPFKKFRAHGHLIKEGKKMSKSKGNVVNPDDYFKKYGADTVRMYLMFTGPFSEGGDWSDKGIVGIYRFLNRVWIFCARLSLAQNGKADLIMESLRQKTIKKVTESLEELHYNTAISALMEYLNAISSGQFLISKEHVETLLILLAPFAPYITEELWQELQTKNYKPKTSAHNQPWPKYNSKSIQEEKIKLVLQVNGKVRDVIEVDIGISEQQAQQLALKNEKIQKWLEDKEPKKIIFVSGRLVNVVI